MRFGGVETERHDHERVIIVVITMGRVEKRRNRGETRSRIFEIALVGTVELKFELIRRTEETHRRTVRLRGRQKFDGMVETQFLHGGTRTDVLLGLRDDHIDRLLGEVRALGFVEENIVCVTLPITGSSARTPRDSNFDVVVAQSCQRNCLRPAFTKEETQRIERRRTAVVPSETRLGKVLRKELRRDVLREDGVLRIDDGAPDEKFHLVDKRGPVRNARRLGAGVGHQIDVRKHITLAIEANGGGPTVIHAALDNRALGRLRKVSVSLKRRAPEADFWLAGDEHILLADGEESCRHLTVVYL